MISKKGQNLGQVLVYLISIVVVGIILLFGYNAIMNFNKQSQLVAKRNFEKSLESSIRTISNQYGTLKEKEFELSGNFKEVCFMENYNFDSTVNMVLVLADYPLIEDTLDAGVPTSNIFLIDIDENIDSYDIGKIEVNGNFECFEVINSRVAFIIEGKGDHVIVR